MANLTLAIPEELLRRARIRALEQGTSVNAVVRKHLERYAGESPARGALASFLDTAREAGASIGAQRTWSRDELHER